MYSFLCLSLCLIFSVNSKPFLLASFPRSGSTFLARIVAESVQGKFVDPPWYVKDKYKHSFTMASGIFGSKYLQQFTYNTHTLFHEIPSLQLEKSFSDWDKTQFKGTKELSLFANIKLFAQKFDTTLLYRHRRYSFPSAMPDLLLKIYDSFVASPYSDKALESIRDYLLSTPKSPIEKQCAAHMVAWYIMFKQASDLHLPIIEWRQLMLLHGDQLADYLEDRFPEGVGDPREMAQIIDKKRMGSFKDFWKKGYMPAAKYIWRNYIKGVNPLLAEKEEKYYALGVEEFNQQLLAYINKVDPDFDLKGFLN